MKILITGASGFVGKALTSYLEARGYTVVPLQFRLGESIENLPSADVLIHCAWDASLINEKDARRINVEGSLRLYEQCKKQNIKFIFISSMAAHKGAHSVYGKTKREVENGLDADACIIKPGIIIGQGGLFKTILELARKVPILPVFYRNAYLQTIYIDDLCSAIHTAIENHLKGTYPLAHKETISVTDFYRAAARTTGKNPRLLFFPGDVALALVTILEKMGLRLPITSNNLLGLKYVTYFDTKNSCTTLGIEPKSFSESLEALKIENR